MSLITSVLFNCSAHSQKIHHTVRFSFVSCGTMFDIKNVSRCAEAPWRNPRFIVLICIVLFLTLQDGYDVIVTVEIDVTDAQSGSCRCVELSWKDETVCNLIRGHFKVHAAG